jgi:hypothetical protein
MGKQQHRILAAFPPRALPIVERVLGAYVRLIPAHTFTSAAEILARDADLTLILCGAHFDESRMFDFLRFARDKFPKIPFVCCRALDAEIPRFSVEALGIAANTLSAAFLDLPRLVRELGVDQADLQFRSAVLAYLPGSAAGKAI